MNTAHPHSQSQREAFERGKVYLSEAGLAFGSHAHRYRPSGAAGGLPRPRYMPFPSQYRTARGHALRGGCHLLSTMCELAHTSRGNLLAKNLAELEPLARTRWRRRRFPITNRLLCPEQSHPRPLAKCEQFQLVG